MTWEGRNTTQYAKEKDRGTGDGLHDGRNPDELVD